MFKLMDANDRAYHAGASDNALIVDDEEFPAMIVIDGDRIEVYWTDDELDAHNYFKITPMPEAIGVGLHATISRWMETSTHYSTVQSLLTVLLPDLGFRQP